MGGQGPGGHGAGAAAAGRGGDVTAAGARRGGWRVPLPGNGRAWGRRTAAARAGRGGGAAEVGCRPDPRGDPGPRAAPALGDSCAPGHAAALDRPPGRVQEEAGPRLRPPAPGRLVSVPQRPWPHSRPPALPRRPRRPPAPARCSAGQPRHGGVGVSPRRLCGPGGAEMQGQRRRGAGPGHAPPVCGSPRAGNEGAGEVSLYRASRDSGASPAPGRRRGAGAQCVRSAPRTSGGGDGVSACTVSTPDPGEHSSAWGEFEGFQESSAKSPHFSQPFELPDRHAGRGLQSAASTPKERGSGQPQRGGPGAAGTPGTSASEVFLPVPVSAAAVWHSERSTRRRPPASVGWPGRRPVSLLAFVLGWLAS